MLVHTWFEYHAKTRPDVPFVELDDRILTYAEAEARANRWANAMLAEGLKPGDRIAYLSKNDADMAVMYIACAKAGVAPVMLNYRLVAREWLWILQDAECSLFFGRGADYLLRKTCPAGEPSANVAAYKEHHPGVLRTGTRLLFGVEETLRALHQGRLNHLPVAVKREVLEDQGELGRVLHFRLIIKLSADDD